jgi:hypothetical protein
MFHTKKSTLTTIFTFFIFSHISALNMQDLNISNYTTQEINGGIYRSYIDEDRAVYVQHWQELDSNNFMSYETPIDISYSPDLNLNNNQDSQSTQYNTETPDQSQSSKSQQHDHMEDWLKDNVRDSFVEQMESNRTQQTNIGYNHTPPKNAQYDRNYVHAIQWQLFKQALDKTNNSYDLANKLSLPTVKEYLKQLRHDTAAKHASEHRRFLDRKKTFPIEEAELKFLDLLISGEISELLRQIQNPVLSIAEAAFTKLKELWPWQRNHTFLTGSFVNGTGETGFIVHLGIDIMAIAERDLISQPDYIAKYADPESFKIIQDFREKCINFQQKGDRSALLKEEFRLRDQLFKNGKNDDFTANVCYAIVEKIYSDSITNVLYEIVHTQSLEKAHNQLQYLEIQILDQAKQHNITLTDQIKDVIIKQYGFDPIEAAYNCYTLRPDYIKTVNDLPILSNNNISPILRNIENKSLSAAHQELTHLHKQIIGTLESLNITDKAIQKELIVKRFGLDILETAHKTYEARADHKQLAESFMAIDVNQAAIKILENNNSYESVANEMNNLAQHIFGNARLCNLSNLSKIESHVYDSIDAIRIAQDHPTFIFNFSMANRTLGDIQQLAHAILSGTHPVLQRSSELLLTGFGAFFKGLNPVTQVSNMGHLAYDLGSLLKKSGAALWNDPIAVMHNSITTTFTLTELIINTAHFTSDLTVGKLYLSPEEYQQRIDAFCEIMEPLQGVTGDQCAVFIGKFLADAMFIRGLGTAYTFLKEIDVLEKLGKSAAIAARTFKKGFDAHLADNPILVTAEGITIKMSNDLKKFGEKIKNGSIGQKVILRVNNMKEFFDLPFGQTLYPHSVKTPHHYQKFSIYKLTQDIPGTELKEGFFYYVDSLHRDHLEVFSKNLKAIAVYNLDGTLNEKKLEAAKKAGRCIKKIMK